MVTMRIRSTRTAMPSISVPRSTVPSNFVATPLLLIVLSPSAGRRLPDHEPFGRCARRLVCDVVCRNERALPARLKAEEVRTVGDCEFVEERQARHFEHQHAAFGCIDDCAILTCKVDVLGQAVVFIFP